MKSPVLISGKYLMKHWKYRKETTQKVTEVERQLSEGLYYSNEFHFLVVTLKHLWNALKCLSFAKQHTQNLSGDYTIKQHYMALIMQSGCINPASPCRVCPFSFHHKS